MMFVFLIKSVEKLKLVAVILLFTLISCQPNEKMKLDTKIEIAKWRKQLLLNGEIGTPCDFDNKEEWAKNNPEAFYGLPDTISSIQIDANLDGKNDLLLYFPAGNCCSGTPWRSSNYLKLIYSNGDKYYVNDNLAQKIERKIEEDFYGVTTNISERVVFSVTEFKTVIRGTYELWTKEDPDCCGSVEGTFTYNPFSFEMEVTRENVNQNEKD